MPGTMHVEIDNGFKLPTTNPIKVVGIARNVIPGLWCYTIETLGQSTTIFPLYTDSNGRLLKRSWLSAMCFVRTIIRLSSTKDTTNLKYPVTKRVKGRWYINTSLKKGVEIAALLTPLSLCRFMWMNRKSLERPSPVWSLRAGLLIQFQML